MSGGFETTDWTLIRTARGNDRSAQAALARLCTAYWYPL